MHQVLTPSGYRDAYTLQFGDEVCAFDMETGAPIINTLESKPQWIDRTEWERWWQVEDETPPFQFFLINGTWLLNSEQSIWRNGINVCHAKHLVVGDTIYDDEDNAVEITSIEPQSADGWWRFDVSGDHSFIIDGLTVHNANRHWVGGTGDWTAGNTTNWSSSAGGASGSSVPGSADNVTFSSSSGAGTCTLNFGGTITIQFISISTYTGTWDNSVNNNNMTLSQTGQAFNCSSTGAFTLKLGTATYTLTHDTASADFSNPNMTFTGNTGANWVFSGASGVRQFTPGPGYAHGNISFPPPTGGGYCILDDGSGSVSINSLSITAPNYLRINTTNTITITNALAIAGTSSNQITIVSGTHAVKANVAVAGGSTFEWCSFRDINFTSGSPVATNSFDSLNNSGITITAPSGGAAASARVIGG